MSLLWWMPLSVAIAAASERSSPACPRSRTTSRHESCVMCTCVVEMTDAW